jgi:dipeptidyl aminopeptidase/acylaminoacyl peptidase
MTTIRSLVAFLLVATVLTGRSDAQTDAKVKVPANVIFQPNLVYSKPNETALMLDVAIPKEGKGPFPAILLFNGIGPLSNGRAGPREYALGLAQKGYVALAVGFRHESKHAFPAAYEDAFAALDWVMTQGEKHQIDKNRVGAMGFSGGGVLAMMLGTKKPGKVQAVVSLYGPCDMTMLHQKSEGFAKYFFKPMLEEWLSGTPEKAPKNYREASPINFVNKGAAPHLFIHGTADAVVPLEQSRIMANKLKAAGVKVNLLALEGASHNFDKTPGLYSQVALCATELFFAEHLSQRPSRPVEIEPITLSPSARPKS